MHGLYVTSIWLHIIAASVWVGGMIFFVAVVVPVTRRPELRESVGSLIHILGVRFRWVGWIALTTLVLTGIFNLYYRGIGWSDLVDREFWAAGFGHTLGIKLALVLVILVASGIHDFIVGPRATRALRNEPGSRRARRLRRAASHFGRLNLLLGLVVVALGVMLVRGAPF